uniref:Dolichyldiphosphatase 1 n=1 Tax=Caligus rogercresseyi TaxID=217165 RepID=C1BQ01_CALRO|nr:Dolichyldiphosphatase 1 [Caligus rogercresseyi]
MDEHSEAASVKWKTFQLTHIEYVEGDYCGKFLAVLSLSPLVIAIFFMSAFFIRRDLHTLSYGIGIILNTLINSILKKVIKEPRPLKRDEIFEEYGMPSSHSQFMCFAYFYFILFITFRVRHKFEALEMCWKGLSVLGLGVLTLLVSYGRLYLQYHTLSQVFVGALVGILFASLWFLLTQTLFAIYFPVIASWRISEFFLIRDTSLIPNIFWFEYTSARVEAKNRSKRSGKLKNS